jgi:Caspase domain
MPRTLYAFLVGIDEYPAPIRSLSGCVNDVEAFAEYLRQRVDGAQGITLDLKMLRNTEATRDAVIGGFRQHLGNAAKGDIALFYYAGHGAQEQAPPEFWPLEPDRLNETLVCHDSRLDGGWDLADKELNKLINEVTAKDPHMVLILDSCHSGSATRDLAEQRTNVRLAQIDSRVRPLSSFIVSVEEAFRLAGPGAVAAGNGGLAAGMGRYVVLSACRDNQLAQEYPGDNKPRGAFSYFLNETLRTASGPISYRDLFARASSLMQAKLEDQVPVLDAPSAGDLESLFLDGAIRPAEPAYNVTFRQGDWLLGAGAVHGLPKPFGNETIELALYPFDA